MGLDLDKVFGTAPLGAYSALDRIKIRAIAFAFRSIVRLLGWTLRYETDNAAPTEDALRSGKVPIYCFWHDRMLASTYFFRNREIVVMSSKSFDGECMTRTIRKLGYGTVRGSSTRGGVGALLEMIKFVKEGYPAGFTVDGPRGPRHEAKSGQCVLAKKTGNPMVPFIVETASFKELKTWDRLQIPRMFSRAKVFYGAPIFVSSDANDEDIEAKRLELQRSLMDLVEKGEAWRESL